MDYALVFTSTCPGKCEIYWPSGNQAFPEFPAEVTRIGELQHGVELLGSPVFGDAEFFCTAVGRRVSKVLAAEAHLEDLDHTQVALHLLQSCLSICKINHLLRTVDYPQVLPLPNGRALIQVYGMHWAVSPGHLCQMQHGSRQHYLSV